MQISTTTMKSSMEIPQKLEIELPYDAQWYHSWASTQKNIRQDTIESPVHWWSSQHYSQ
jgi:hypothetical protein